MSGPEVLAFGEGARKQEAKPEANRIESIDLQRIGNQTVNQAAVKYAPKQLKNPTELAFFRKKETLEYMSWCLTQPNAAKLMDEYLVKNKINFPERSHINSFFGVMKEVNDAKVELHNDLAKIRDDDPQAEQKRQDAVNKYKTRMSNIRQRHKVEITDQDINKNIEDALKSKKAVPGMGFGLDISTSPFPAAALLMRDAAVAVSFEVANILQRAAEKAEEELRKPRAKPAQQSADKEKVEEEVKKATKAGDEMNRTLKDQEEAFNKAGQVATTSEKQAPAASETKYPKPLADASSPRMRKAPAPDKEVLPPDEFGGGTRVKAPKATKNPLIKTEIAEKGPEAQARTAILRINELEKKHAGNGIKPGRFEEEVRTAVRTGNTKSLKDYLDQLSRAILTAVAAKPPAAGGKQAKM